MKKTYSSVTKSEREVLELLWEQNQPLTPSEIVKLSEGKTWKSSYIHLMINSLLKKGVIQVAGFKQCTKNYARTFEPTLSREEFSVRMLREQNHLNSSSLSLLFSALLEDEDDPAVIEQLGQMIESKRQEIEANKKKDSEDKV